MLVLFDIDDTLIAHSRAEHLGCLEFFDRYRTQVAYSVGEFPRIWRDLAETHFAAYTRGEVAFLDQRRIRMRHLFPGLPDTECDARFDIYLGKL
jgi:FMN phosphatase YigB (HAD superfamily)